MADEILPVGPANDQTGSGDSLDDRSAGSAFDPVYARAVTGADSHPPPRVLGGAETAAKTRPVRPGRRRWAAIGRALFLVAALGVLGWQVARDADGVAEALGQIGAGHAVASAMAALAGLGASGLAWRALLAALGSPLPARAVPPVFFVAQIGKYLPGAVWPYLAQVRLGREYGVAGSRSAACSVLFVIAHCATGGAVAAALLPWVDTEVSHKYWWALVFAPLLLLVLHPRVLLPLLRRAHRLARRGAVPERLDGRRIAVAVAWLGVTWACYGASLLVLVTPLAHEGTVSLAALATGGYALAWTVGFAAAAVLVIAAPAGLGFREVVLIAVLTPVMPAASATAVALVSRVVQTLGDALWALTGALLGRRGRAGSRPADGTMSPAAAAADR
jgi:glycosyltransferase 2 family protein